MSLDLSPVVGTISIEPLVDAVTGPASAAYDSALEHLLSELAHRERLADGDRPIRLIAAARLSRCGFGPDQTQAVVRADLARLLADLEAEYDDLQISAP
jgi:hypothetical protein